MNHKKRRVEFAVKNMKQDFDKVMFTDECLATLDGPDGFSRGWVLNKLEIPFRLPRQQGGGGVMFRAAILGSKLIGPFKVPDSVELTAFKYTEYLEQNLIPETLLEPVFRTTLYSCTTMLLPTPPSWLEFFYAIIPWRESV